MSITPKAAQQAPQQTDLQTEKEIIRDLWVYLKAHDVPPIAGTAENNIFWTQAVKDLGAVIVDKWHDHPLATKVGLAIYDYLSEKCVAASRSAAGHTGGERGDGGANGAADNAGVNNTAAHPGCETRSGRGGGTS